MSDSGSIPEEQISDNESDHSAGSSNAEKRSVAHSAADSQPASQAGSQVQILDDDDGCPPSPTSQEIEEYADFLGIDLKTESHLMWIAKEGVAAPVPAPWKACRQGDEVFYFNFETKQSIWDHPCDQKYRDMVDKARKVARGEEEDDDESKEGSKQSIGSDLDNSSKEALEASQSGLAGGNVDINENSQSSFVSDAVEDADKVESKPPARMDQSESSGGSDQDDTAKESRVSQAASPTAAEATSGVVSTSHAAEATEDDADDKSHSSFVSEAVESAPSSPRSASDDGEPEAPASASASAVAEGAAQQGKGPAQLGEEADQSKSKSEDEERPLHSPSQKEMVAMWAAASGGYACSTPRSRSSSSSSTGSPKGSEANPAAAANAAPPPAKNVNGSSVMPSSLDRFQSAGEVTLDPRTGSKSSEGSPPPQSPGLAARDLPESPPSSHDSATVFEDNAVGAGDKSPAGAVATSPHHQDDDGKASPQRSAFEQPAPAGPSAKSSCPSEVSEDFRSDWGAPSPSFSAKSTPPNGIAPLTTDSLEVSASASLDFMSNVALVMGSAAAGALGQDSHSTVSGAPKTWKELERDMIALEEVLDTIKKVREQQQDFLRRLVGTAA
mmetsp:Transcript_10365/g.23401  ORF Transcript_10365/g.23401 Transcript_10365/m.23401 type:complete len:614 (-) Transcript_10365:118-1959(-)